MRERERERERERAGARSFFSLSEKEAKERSFLVLVFLIFSARLSLLARSDRGLALRLNLVRFS